MPYYDTGLIDMIDIIQGIGDFFAGIGSWVADTIQQATELASKIGEYVDLAKSIISAVWTFFPSLFPDQPVIVAMIYSAIVLVVFICVWEIVN